MQKQEALKKVEEIHAVIRASNRVPLAGKSVVTSGIVMLIYTAYIMILIQCGVFLYLDRDLHWTGQGQLFAIIITLGPLLLVRRLIFFFLRRSTPTKEIQALSVGRAISWVCWLVVIDLFLSNELSWAVPLVALIAGISYLFLGKFSMPSVSRWAWTQIGIGLLVLYLNTRYPLPRGIWNQLGWSLFGPSLIGMGWNLLREERRRAA